jgi:ribonuclease HII
MVSLLEIERDWWSRGLRRVGGVDEAGRGPLAGPVFAAVVVLPPDVAEREAVGRLAGLTDSKQLSPSRRLHFFDLLHAIDGVEIAVGVSERDEIDAINILKATHLAMGRAIAALAVPPERVLVDGLPVPGLPCPSTAVVGGDAKSLSIAAASVVAKVLRDRRMTEMECAYPAYGFARHKGYGSREHIQALFEHGPCPEHRRSFRPVREAEAIRSLAPDDGDAHA